jgi:hypothetical protein
MVSTTPCISKSLESLDASANVKAIFFYLLFFVFSIRFRFFIFLLTFTHDL